MSLSNEPTPVEKAILTFRQLRGAMIAAARLEVILSERIKNLNEADLTEYFKQAEQIANPPVSNVEQANQNKPNSDYQHTGASQ